MIVGKLSRWAVTLISTFAVTAPLSSQEIDWDQLESELMSIGRINSVLIEQHGQLLLEAYRGEMNRHRTTNIKSASKSLLSLLVGIAIEEGFIESVDQPIGEFFPDYFADHPDNKKQSITLANLLSMQAGIASTSRRNYGAWVLSDSWFEYALDQPFVEQVGGRMIYSTGNSHLLSVVLTRATGMSTRDFAERYLFDPLNIRVGGWDQDPQGYYMGGNNLAISPWSMLKIGKLVLNNGVFEGKQLVAESWLQVALDSYTRSNFNPYDYGYHWWRQPIAGYTLHFAWGNGGQYIMVLPELDTVLAITSDPDVPRGSRASRQQLFGFIGQRVIPILENRDL